MGKKSLSVAKLHDEWSSGRGASVLDALWRNRGYDRSEQKKRTALQARYCAQSGRSKAAFELLSKLDDEASSKTSRETALWINNARAFFAYEISKDFGLARAHFEATTCLEGIEKDDIDLNLLTTASYWRLSVIDLARGDRRNSDLFMDVALCRARDLGMPHLKGIVLLANGFRYLATCEPKRAQDEFLKGLFLVGYDNRSLPKYLHAELMLGVLLAQNACGDIKKDRVLDPITTLNRIELIMSQGRRQFVTPFPNIGIISPTFILEKLLTRPLTTHGRIYRYRTAVLIKEAANNGLDYCQKCSSIVDLTIDHLFPRWWGGTDHDENLRILCRSCNSERQHKFVWVDERAYDKLRLSI